MEKLNGIIYVFNRDTRYPFEAQLPDGLIHTMRSILKLTNNNFDSTYCTDWHQSFGKLKKDVICYFVDNDDVDRDKIENQLVNILATPRLANQDNVHQFLRKGSYYDFDLNVLIVYDMDELIHYLWSVESDAEVDEENQLLTKTATDILNKFEDLLNAKNIVIPCANTQEEKQRNNENNSANLYGTEYSKLEEDIECILYELLNEKNATV